MSASKNGIKQLIVTTSTIISPFPTQKSNEPRLRKSYQF
jgi:hypothetical protein